VFVSLQFFFSENEFGFEVFIAVNIKVTSETELFYNWRFTANQFVMAISPLRLTTSNILSTEQSLCNICNGLSFTIAAGPHQHSHSQILVPQDSWPHFIFSDYRLPHPGGSDPLIYIPKDLGGPVPPGIGFPFRGLL
jgi:hypothetical protein